MVKKIETENGYLVFHDIDNNIVIEIEEKHKQKWIVLNGHRLISIEEIRNNMGKFNDESLAFKEVKKIIGMFFDNDDSKTLYLDVLKLAISDANQSRDRKEQDKQDEARLLEAEKVVLEKAKTTQVG